MEINKVTSTMIATGDSDVSGTHHLRVSLITIALGVAFGFVFLFTQGGTAFAQYETAYFLEEMLSVDNVAVIATIFALFGCSDPIQRKALTYGIIGAVVMRLAFVLIGAEALERFEFVSIIFGALLGFSAWKLFTNDDAGETHEPRIVGLLRRFFPRMSTLVAVIVAVEVTDLIFAIDSVPVVLSVTDNRLIAFTSNVAAIMGLRSLFFVLRDGMNRIVYLNETLAIVLAYVGAKMMLSQWVHINEVINIAIIASIFTAGIALSYTVGKKE
jgi:tellurite resistance protein TerC